MAVPDSPVRDSGRMETHTSDIVVIGGGVIGICSAYFLSLRGFRVTVVERGEVGSGCSFGNAGYACPSHFVPLASPGIISKGARWLLNPSSPFYIKPRLDPGFASWLLRFRAAARPERSRAAMPILRDLNAASVRLYKELSGLDGMAFDFRENGIVMLYNSSRGEEEEIETAEHAHRLGVEARVLTAEAINRLDPGLRTCARGGVYYPGDCHLDPQQFVQSLARLTEKRGVTILRSAEVAGISLDKGRITALDTTRGIVCAEQFVLAAGSWSPGIARKAGMSLSLQAGKGYSVTIPNPPRAMSIPAILTEARVAVTPFVGRLRLGGTLELSGMDLSINVRRVRAILHAVPRYLSDFQPEAYAEISPWAGLRPCTPDGLPYVGRFRSIQNLIAATGHAMLGLSLAPITGKLVSEIAAGSATSIDTELLRPDRYH